MKKVFMIVLGLLTMMTASLSANAQEVTFFLRPGWNWIAYPYPESASIETAFGDFEPMSGDIIESEFGYSEYFVGYGWFGGIYNLEPGKGYIYYSNRTVPVTIVFGTPSSQSQVTVTTSEPLLITAISAMSGGEVISNDGTYILVKGLCWAAHENPTTNDFYQEMESGEGSFTVSMSDLNIGTTYYVRAYAVTPNGMVYGDQKSFTTRDGIPEVSTNSVTNILGDGATCGGTVTDNGGLNVTARGVCWSTSPSPTISNSHTTNGSGLGNFTSNMTGLTSNTTYFVRAYAFTSYGTGYGEELSFTTLSGGGNDHDYVDLGLPSSLLWATCNVGAETPEDYGDYFAWGETQPKDRYDWSTYQYCNGSNNTLTKYCYDSDYGYNGFTDDLTILLPEDDAATGNWGSEWRVPTREEWQELYNNTTFTWTQQNGVNGCLFTASNGNSLFLPAAGRRFNSGFYEVEGNGNYWSSSLNPYYPSCGWEFYFNSDYCSMSGPGRTSGYTVRPVRSSAQSNVPTGAIDGKFTINYNGDQVYFSQGNLQYIGSAATPYWKFADNQWDVLGTTTGQNSSDQNVDRDLFGWGTSGCDHGAVCYQPWSTSQTDSDYYVYGNYIYNLYDQTGQADWGYNPICNGGNQSNQWRTLTTNEWQFVFNYRTTSSGIRYAKANVNSVNGVILLPDYWSSSYYSLSNTNNTDASFSSNIVSASQWSILEHRGAVFLPAAGYRYGTSVVLVESDGDYWSASDYNHNNDIYGAHCIRFYSSNLYPGNVSNRSHGLSVRVVCSAQ